MEITRPENELSRYPTVGRLAVYVVRDVTTWEGGTEAGDRYLLDFTGADWDALFRELFNCPQPEPYIDGENIDEYDSRYRTRFQLSIPEYPMLARIWDIYVDARYEVEEIEQLQDECLKVRLTTENSSAVKALGKLLLACREALKEGRGLFLASD